jgi:hypothetical protein
MSLAADVPWRRGLAGRSVLEDDMTMTTQRKLKSAVRARMAKTGERYASARRIVTGQLPSHPPTIHPETSATAKALAAAGIPDPTTGDPLSEAMVLGVGGGLGAGYILWQFKAPDRRVVTTGFRNSWQYPERWLRSVGERLGLRVTILETAARGKAARQLDEVLDANATAITWVSAADLPYWHLPTDEWGWWGYPIAVVGRDRDRYLVDDRNEERLTLAPEELSRARGRIASYRNRLAALAGPALTDDRLVAAIREGLHDQVRHLSLPSDSFSLPAIHKWARMLVDERNPKSWPRVFADRKGLYGALLSTWESVTVVGILGGTLRGLYAHFLQEAAERLGEPALAPVARAYADLDARWAAFANACLPAGFEPLRQAASLSRRRREAVSAGDRASDRAAAVARELRELGAPYREDLPLSSFEIRSLFEAMSSALADAARAEDEALAALRHAVGD